MLEGFTCGNCSFIHLHKMKPTKSSSSINKRSESVKKLSSRGRGPDINSNLSRPSNSKISAECKLISNTWMSQNIANQKGLKMRKMLSSLFKLRLIESFLRAPKDHLNCSNRSLTCVKSLSKQQCRSGTRACSSTWIRCRRSHTAVPRRTLIQRASSVEKLPYLLLLIAVL